MADKFALREYIQLNTRVVGATFDEAANCWDIRTGDGDHVRAHFLVAAVGKLHLIAADMVKEGATVIDVGMNRGQGQKVSGDVDPGAAERAAYMTPVPGGVGPLKIALADLASHVRRLRAADGTGPDARRRQTDAWREQFAHRYAHGDTLKPPTVPQSLAQTMSLSST